MRSAAAVRAAPAAFENQRTTRTTGSNTNSPPIVVTFTKAATRFIRSVGNSPFARNQFWVVRRALVFGNFTQREAEMIGTGVSCLLPLDALVLESCDDEA